MQCFPKTQLQHALQVIKEEVAFKEGATINVTGNGTFTKKSTIESNLNVK